MAELLMGVDIGTSGSKCVLTTTSGEIVATAAREHDVAKPGPGRFEHDAESVWRADFDALVAELLPYARPYGHTIRALGVSGIGPCVLPAAADGTPLRPAILYGVDTRAAAEIDELTERYGAAEIQERCGSRLSSQAAGPKIAWVRRHEPEVYERTRRFFAAPGSYLVHELTGEYVLDHHSASQCTPLYDTRANAWIETWAAETAPALTLPRLAWPGEVVGTVTNGPLGGVPVIAGTIDAWAEAASVGVTEPGDVMLMYGTTMFIIQVITERVTSDTLWGTVGVTRGSHTLAAGMATSGAITGWLRELTGSDYATLTREAKGAGPGAGGLLMLPYFAGERTPFADPDARGTLIGLTLRHGRGHLYRAALEATAYGVRHNLEAMGSSKRLVAVGGGTQGGLWTRVVSDVVQRPQVLPTYTVGAAYGDARLAAEATGSDTRGWNPPARVVEPDPSLRDTYDGLYDRYRALYPATKEIAHYLAEIG